MKRLRVINLGLPKSGTTTLGKALRLSGLKTADWKVRKGQSADPAVAGQFVGDLMYRGYFDFGDPLFHLTEFDAFSEISLARPDLNRWPQTDWGLIQTIIDRHPGARFILSYRNAADHVDSMMRWTNLGSQRLPRLSVPGLPSGFGQSREELIRWVEGHEKFCRQVFKGRRDFLAYDIRDPDAPAEIGAFLGVEIKWWGTANPNPDAAQTNTSQAHLVPEGRLN
ncbi:hypothetical protein AB9K41_04765 [Cribrihabitans sp. XS_ASV171]